MENMFAKLIMDMFRKKWADDKLILFMVFWELFISIELNPNSYFITNSKFLCSNPSTIHDL